MAASTDERAQKTGSGIRGWGRVEKNEIEGVPGHGPSLDASERRRADVRLLANSSDCSLTRAPAQVVPHAGREYLDEYRALGIRRVPLAAGCRLRRIHVARLNRLPERSPGAARPPDAPNCVCRNDEP